MRVLVAVGQVPVCWSVRRARRRCRRRAAAEAGRLRRGEAIHEGSHGVVRLGVVAVLRGEPDARLKPVVDDAVGGGEEQMLADIDGLAGLQWQRDQLAGIVLRKGDVPRTLRLRHHQRHAREHALPRASQRHHGDVHLRVLPQQHVMREVDAVLGRQLHVGNRHILAFDLAEGVAELQLGHVLAAWQFSPSGPRGRGRGFRRRCAASRTTQHSRVDGGMAPDARGLRSGRFGSWSRRRRGSVMPAPAECRPEPAECTPAPEAERPRAARDLRTRHRN